MKRILLIKLTSLGDLIHALPALTDLHWAHPDLKVDWLIDENFSEIASWHPAVGEIFTTNHRQWKKGLVSALGPIYKLIKKLQKTKYDLVIDGQGNFKSALLTLFMRGPKAGFDKHSVRERIAHLAYQRRYPASKTVHAIDRLRQLFALALNYPSPVSPPDFLIDRDRLVRPSLTLPSPYLVFIHNASWKTKLWSEKSWVEMIQKATARGYPVVLPWGNEEERMRAVRLAIKPQVIVLPKLSLSEMGYVLAHAKACVGMDTGLSHLVAALNIPSLTLYGATDSGRTGASGQNQLHIQSTLRCAPCNKKTCRFPSATSLDPPCLTQITPDQAFQIFERFLGVEKPALCIRSS